MEAAWWAADPAWSASILLFVVAVLVAMRRFAAGGVNPHREDGLMSGRTVVVTGANTGLGFEAAKELARLGAHVVMACRSLERGRAALEEVERAARSGGSAEVQELDLGDVVSVRRFAEAYRASGRPLHVLVNNAGIMHTVGTARQETVDGFEAMFGTNHLGHFLLTTLLLDVLVESKPARVVTVSSIAHNHASIRWEDVDFRKAPIFVPFAAYGQSKLANGMFTRALARRVEGTGVTAVFLHPGVIPSELMRHTPGFEYVRWLLGPLMPLVTKTPWEGAQTTLYCATAPESELHNGGYYKDCAEVPSPNALTRDDAACERLWALSDEAVHQALLRRQ